MKELSLNILDIAENSVKAGAALTEIIIDEKGEKLELTIKDDGCGMSEEIVKSVIEFAKEQLPGEKVTEQDVKKMLAQAGTILALNVLNDIAFNVSNDCTITALREIPEPKDNYAVFELMMEENTGNTSEFVARAISLRGQLDNSPYAKMLIAQIARKHLIYTSSVDHREIDRLISGKVLSSQSKASLLLGQGSKSKD